MPDLSSLRRLSRSLRRLGQTHYPRFLFGAGLHPGEIPIFVFHDVRPDEFAADLEFLRRNHYRCLSADEYLERQGRPCTERAVLLTFDDAVQNFYDVTLPLLRQYECPATLFVPTFWMRGAASESETATVAPSGRDGFMSWDGLRTCLESGLVDVQLHGHRHALVFTSNRLVGFASPELLRRHHIFDWPMRREAKCDALGRPALGTPIYEAQPLLSAHHRIIEDEAAADACGRMVSEAGGAMFFERPGWAAQLRAVIKQHRGAMTPIPPGALRSFVASEFEQAAALFARELGTRPRHLAYPWQLGSELSLELAHEAGLRSVFGVGLDFRRIRRLRTLVPAIARIKGEWLRFLPGEGRRHLREVIPEKVRSFIRSQHFAH